jgi:hypothetical protein
MPIDDDDDTIHTPFEIFVRGLKGTKLPLNVVETNTISELKGTIVSSFLTVKNCWRRLWKMQFPLLSRGWFLVDAFYQMMPF